MDVRREAGVVGQDGNVSASCSFVEVVQRIGILGEGQIVAGDAWYVNTASGMVRRGYVQEASWVSRCEDCPTCFQHNLLALFY